MHALSSSEIRAQFLQFFEKNGHQVVESASLVPPGNDGSLLFTNAGMVPFKQVFLGAEQRPYVRATSAQRCVRAGGKHNDLDQVGITRRHHTQFEMLGNFSFGDYFKEEAIQYGWKFLTENLALPTDRLHVTVLYNDDEARALWRKIAGLRDGQIRSCEEDDNFWAMGDSGPCGPCSEIFWDLGDHIADPDERYLELWNLVFMQFSRNEGDATGALHPLPEPSVDTGMGLERIASVLQRVPSNYHTDLFVPILQQAASVLDAQRVKSASSRSFSDALREEIDPKNPQFGANAEIQTLRIIADHLRASYAMLSDGIFPSNIGRGYVLRRIIRRAIRVAQNNGVQDAFLTKIVVPEWESANGFVQMRAIIANEEKAFAEMLANGKRALDKVFVQAAAGTGSTIPGIEAFRLYDTYGIPLDITQTLAEEKGLSVDTAGFELAMEEHRRKAIESSAFTSSHGDVAEATTASSSIAGSEAVITTFTGYDSLAVTDARVLQVWRDATSSSGKNKSGFWLSLSPCPFYAEGGGQVGDRGHLLAHQAGKDTPLRIAVQDTKRLANDTIALHCVVPEGSTYENVELLLSGSNVSVDGVVDPHFRAGCQVHHSATHLLQSALKQVLGDHVTQAGSFVTTDRLRFDFAHFGAMSVEEIAQVEALVNTMALEAGKVQTLELPREEAEQSGAICNFGEKYGDVVRVVRIGDVSSEFCGGTHVSETSSIFPFAILSEGSVAAGTRRMEAVAGIEGAKYLQTKDKTLQQLAAQLETTPAKVPERVVKMQKQLKQLESHAQALGDVLASLPPSPVLSTNAIEVHTLEVGDGSSEFLKVLRRRAEFLRQAREDKAAHVVVMGQQVVCIADGTQIHAGKWLQTLLKALGGRGGGNASFAQGSLPNDVAIDRVCQLVQRSIPSYLVEASASLATFHQVTKGNMGRPNELESIVGDLRGAVRTLRTLGLVQATRFASELLLGVPSEIRSQVRVRTETMENESKSDGEEDDWDTYDAAKASFDSSEYVRAHHMLSNAPMGPATRFLKHYALYLAGEKAKEEMDLEISVTGASPSSKEAEKPVDRHGVNPHLKELYLSLTAAYHTHRLDGFGLYLLAVVLRRLGYTTVTGTLASSEASPDVWEIAESKTSEPSDATGDVTTRRILIDSIRAFPWNWSAWMELALLSPFTNTDEDTQLSAACPWMFHLFQAHVLLDQQQNDAARQVLDQLAVLFPQSTYLLAQQALTSYHMRDFDHAQEQFERLALVDPHRVETMDVYSNVLYVKEDRTELSRLAHRALQVEKYRPETCCIIGNYYSLKNKHDRAIVYFHRALKLDPTFLSAWTLIGHEYVEMKNTSAAIEAYRRAVNLNARDYRAWYGLGQAYEILNMYLYSIYYYKKAAAIRPYDARMWCALGGCYEKLTKHDDAIACFERAVGNNDREGIASYHLGRILAQRGQQHDAAKYYQLHLGLRDLSSLDISRTGNTRAIDESITLMLQRGGANIRLDTPQALAAVLFLANYFKQLGRYQEAAVFCNRLLDLQGPEKEEAKALLREMRSLEATARS
ncbi:hypothetical protein Poli38472_007919 [Pythium oligandrum]|uniref:Alanine--tRNA ligase n=1 Tax=Pythium oligandrum TaxID=41045 RepID=A0A8K1CMV9_PYTOL|nr:hypothetical protein Poli38472_007919 [Pythium oligandrum]|eukprot:TMW65277.1 hypothetical protein Poli38472_007919 [Pythium oligandrum]